MAPVMDRDSGPGGLSSRSLAVLDDLVGDWPALSAAAPQMVEAAERLVGCWQSGGTVFLCGNGGSHADSLHIAGELVKSFERPRPLDLRVREALLATGSPFGQELAGGLQAGLRAVALGANGAVATAIANDIDLPAGGFAQELSALGRCSDVLVALSTSGTSRSVVLAAVVARALGMSSIALVGDGPAGTSGEDAPGGHLRDLADVVIVAPSRGTADVQGWHVRIYHGLCGVVEEEIFGA